VNYLVAAQDGSFIAPSQTLINYRESDRILNGRGASPETNEKGSVGKVGKVRKVWARELFFGVVAELRYTTCEAHVIWDENFTKSAERSATNAYTFRQLSLARCLPWIPGPFSALARRNGDVVVGDAIKRVVSAWSM
jgi:hypothetical protein